MNVGAVEVLETAVEALANTDRHSLPDSLLLERHERLIRAMRRLDAIRNDDLQLIDRRQATTAECAKSTRSWMVENQQVSPHEADARMRVARASVTRPAIGEAMATGDVSLRHAELIVDFLPKLDGEAREVAERELLKAARDVDPATLRRGLQELQDRLCLNETAEERAVRRHEGRWLRWVETIDGMVRLEGMFAAEHATVIRTALAPLSERAGEQDERHIGQRRADGLVELAHAAMDSGRLPDTAGEPTQIVIVTDSADLTRKVQAGEGARSTLNGTPITPNTLRMHACDAGIIPAVMNGASEVLDLGRTRRTWSLAQRRAARLRARGHCEAPGCQAPVGRCQLHHSHYWEHGGTTGLDNAIYLCRQHHWLEHHTSWHFTRNRDGTVEVRRT
jgi:hypothetical protein